MLKRARQTEVSISDERRLVSSRETCSSSKASVDEERRYWAQLKVKCLFAGISFLFKVKAQPALFFVLLISSGIEVIGEGCAIILSSRKLDSVDRYEWARRYQLIRFLRFGKRLPVFEKFGYERTQEEEEATKSQKEAQEREEVVEKEIVKKR
jgi:hypothetical protein